MLSPFGTLPGQVAGLSHSYGSYDAELGDVAHQRPPGAGVDPLAGHFLDLDVPLFPLTNYASPDTYFQSQ